MQLVGRLPKKNRLFQTAEIAEAMVGREVAGVQRNLAKARLTVQRAINDNRAFERGTTVSARDRITVGLRQRELEG